jgi:hypothetical protein
VGAPRPHSHFDDRGIERVACVSPLGRSNEFFEQDLQVEFPTGEELIEFVRQNIADTSELSRI